MFSTVYWTEMVVFCQHRNRQEGMSVQSKTNLSVWVTLALAVLGAADLIVRSLG